MGAASQQNQPGPSPFQSRGLVVVPEGSASFREDGRVVIEARLLAEVRSLARAWGGPAAVLLPDGGPSAMAGGEDLRMIEPSELPFGLFEIVLDDEQSIASAVVDAGVVVVSADESRVKIMEVCRRLGVPFVADSTAAALREGRLSAGGLSAMFRIGQRRAMEELAEMCSMAAGIQCGATLVGSGQSKRWAPSGTLLYRAAGPMRCSRETDIEQRRELALLGRPIRVGFVGPLTSATGADRLPEIAAELKQLKVAFELDIVGDGPLRAGLRRYCERQGGCRGVTLRGGRTWPAGAMDLLLCPGREADERIVLAAMAGGVPVVTEVGGMTAALLAAAERETGEPAGWRVFADEIAGAIARADGGRQSLVRAGEAAWSFATRHSLDSSARRRVRHLMTVSRRVAQTPGFGEVKAMGVG